MSNRGAINCAPSWDIIMNKNIFPFLGQKSNFLRALWAAIWAKNKMGFVLCTTFKGFGLFHKNLRWSRIWMAQTNFLFCLVYIFNPTYRVRKKKLYFSFNKFCILNTFEGFGLCHKTLLWCRFEWRRQTFKFIKTGDFWDTLFQLWI